VTLREDQIRRYARHILLREVGGTGQERLLASSALVSGELGLESAAVYLAAAGVGRLHLPSAPPALRERLAAINPDCDTAGPGAPDVVIALGAGEAAALASDAAIASGAPLIRAALREEGLEIQWLQPGRDGCARCRPAPAAEPPDPPLEALVGALAATEALLLLLGSADRRGSSARVTASGVFGSLSPLEPAGPCAACGGGAP
jgi:molybdopterin/thiamine biosynthesis adenylyltransferase